MTSNSVGVEFVATVASIVVGFGAVVLMFRIQRELYVREILKSNVNWIARADWLVIIAMFLAGLLGLALPLSGFALTGLWQRLPLGACLSAIILLLGYVFAVLAHYRLLGNGQKKPKGGTEPARKNPEPPEGAIFWVTLVIAALTFCLPLYSATH
jgi:hypothetical protein